MGERLSDAELDRLWNSLDYAYVGERDARKLITEVRAARALRASPPPCSCTCHVGACTSCGCDRRASPPPDPAQDPEVRRLLHGLNDIGHTILAEYENECDVPGTWAVFREHLAKTEAALSAWAKAAAERKGKGAL